MTEKITRDAIGQALARLIIYFTEEAPDAGKAYTAVKAYNEFGLYNDGLEMKGVTIKSVFPGEN